MSRGGKRQKDLDQFMPTTLAGFMQHWDQLAEMTKHVRGKGGERRDIEQRRSTDLQNRNALARRELLSSRAYARRARRATEQPQGAQSILSDVADTRGEASNASSAHHGGPKWARFSTYPSFTL